jgi:hypothetical protein
MKRFAKLSVAATLCVVAAAFVPARAAVTYVVASPGDRSVHSFTTPVVVTAAGGPLTLFNQDVLVHQVASVETAPDTGQRWCKYFAPGACPALWSETVEAGGNQKPVLGIDVAPSGTYHLYDPTDPSTPQMSATLIVL